MRTNQVPGKHKLPIGPKEAMLRRMRREQWAQWRESSVGKWEVPVWDPEEDQDELAWGWEPLGLTEDEIEWLPGSTPSAELGERPPT